jgi:hypothetical protein
LNEAGVKCLPFQRADEKVSYNHGKTHKKKMSYKSKATEKGELHALSHPVNFKI